MSETSSPTVAPSKPKLSSAQMLQLMRLEMDKALRHDYPISSMVVGLDGFEDSEHLDQRKRIMVSIFRELKHVTFSNDVRGLGLFTDRFVLAVFPHVTPEKIGELGQEMLDQAEAIEIPQLETTEEEQQAAQEGEDSVVVIQTDDEATQPTPTRITLSIGVSHNLHQGETTFETLVGDAEMGMQLAQGAGGDRFILAKDVETEIDRLREELQAQISELEGQQDSLLSRDGEEEDWGRNLIQQAIALFQAEPDQSEGVLRMKKAVIGLLNAEVRNWRNTSTVSQMIESQKQIEMMERRITKLTESLGMTEAELKRIAAAKNIDLGLSSIYRTVQGISGDDGNAEQKKEMLKGIFDANMALQGKA